MSPADTMNIDWDKDNAVLYALRKNVSKKTVNVDMLPGVVQRIDPGTKDTVGLIIHNFSKRVPDGTGINEWALMEFFDLFLEMLNSGDRIHR